MTPELERLADIAHDAWRDGDWETAITAVIRAALMEPSEEVVEAAADAVMRASGRLNYSDMARAALRAAATKMQGEE